MCKYVIAKSQCESLLTTKENWEKHQDNLLSIVKEFEADTWTEASDVYESTINPFFRHSPERKL